MLTSCLIVMTDDESVGVWHFRASKDQLEDLIYNHRAGIIRDNNLIRTIVTEGTLMNATAGPLHNSWPSFEYIFTL